jgi:putative Ca2+/H+ antiporter (TMEM165/GDT1 family)
VLDLFLTTFANAFAAEARIDKVVCAGGALAARYPPLAVLAGVSAAFLAKMLLLAYVGAALYSRLPPTLRDLPRFLTAAALLASAFLLLRRSRDEPSSGGKAAEVSLVPRGGDATPVVSGWRAASTVFVVLFLAEWFDRAQFLVITAAAGGLKTVGSFAPLWAGLGGALALIVKEVVAVGVGARVRRLVPTRLLWRIAAVGCVLLAVWALAQEENEGMPAETSPIHTGARFRLPATVMSRR